MRCNGLVEPTSAAVTIRVVRRLLLSLPTLLAALLIAAGAAQAGSAPTGVGLESAVGRSAPLAAALVGSRPLESVIAPRVAGHGYDRIAVATGVAAGGIGGRSQRAIGPAGDAAARGLSRLDRFRALQRDGIQVGSQRYTINEHLINSLRKSGRRHITPEDLVKALQQAPTPGLPGSRVFTNPETGSRFFVNDADEVVGVWAGAFR